jgi:hypothetical protein
VLRWGDRRLIHHDDLAVSGSLGQGQSLADLWHVSFDADLDHSGTSITTPVPFSSSPFPQNCSADIIPNYPGRHSESQSSAYEISSVSGARSDTCESESVEASRSRGDNSARTRKTEGDDIERRAMATSVESSSPYRTATASHSRQSGSLAGAPGADPAHQEPCALAEDAALGGGAQRG